MHNNHQQFYITIIDTLRIKINLLTFFLFIISETEIEIK